MSAKLITVVTANTHPPQVDDGNAEIFQNLAGPVVTTANLPAASASMDARIVIEDGGTGDINLIIYARGERYRINGGSNI